MVDSFLQKVKAGPVSVSKPKNDREVVDWLFGQSPNTFFSGRQAVEINKKDRDAARQDIEEALIGFYMVSADKLHEAGIGNCPLNESMVDCVARLKKAMAAKDPRKIIEEEAILTRLVLAGNVASFELLGHDMHSKNAPNLLSGKEKQDYADAQFAVRELMGQLEKKYPVRGSMALA